MHPIICQIGPFKIYSFGVMLSVAVITCAIFLNRDARRHNLTSEFIFDLIFWVLMGGILGARLFYIFLNQNYFMANPAEIVMIANGGIAWQGGLVGGGLTGYFLIKKNHLPLWPTLDLVAPYIALGHAIGRIGCFLNGCCYGKEVPWGIYFPVHHAYLHPTQLYESFSLFVIFLILKKAQGWFTAVPGKVFVLYLLLASLERFIVEFFRADHTFTWLGLSVFQIISLVVMGVAFYANSVIKSRSGK